MSQPIYLRRGTAAAWTAANTVLQPGETGVETDTGKVKVGVAAGTAWNALAYLTDAVAALITTETARATAAEAARLTQAQADARYPQTGDYAPVSGNAIVMPDNTLFISGAGLPTGNAPVGSIYKRTDAAGGIVFYECTAAGGTSNLLSAGNQNFSNANANAFPGWSTQPGGSVTTGTYGTAICPDGSAGVQLVTTPGSNGNANLQAYPTLVAGTQYVFTAQVWVVAGAAGTYQNRALLVSPPSSENDTFSTAVAGRWTTSSLTFTPSNTSPQIAVFSPVGTVYWRNPTIALAPVWTPASGTLAQATAYSAGVTYPALALAFDSTGLYQSQVSGNVGNALTNPTYWVKIVSAGAGANQELAAIDTTVATPTATGSTAAVAMAGLTATVTATAVPLDISWGSLVSHNTAGQVPILQLTEGGTIIDSIPMPCAVAGQAYPMFTTKRRNPAAGAVTYAVQIAQANATGIATTAPSATATSRLYINNA